MSGGTVDAEIPGTILVPSACAQPVPRLRQFLLPE
jgi:hypothetical protein